MEYMVAVFRARTETLGFASILKSYNIPCMIINTPRVINVSCGISVKFNEQDIMQAKNVICRRKFDSFAGFYKLRQDGYNVIVIKE